MASLEQQFSDLSLTRNLKWFPRPKEKCSGNYYCEKVRLLVNWFKFDRSIYERQYYMYSVEMKKVKLIKDRKSGKMSKKESIVAILDRPSLFWEHMRHDKERNGCLNLEDYVFDNKEIVYSVNSFTEILTSTLQKPNNVTYVMEITPRGPFKLYFSREDPTRDEEVDRSYKFLKAVFTQKVRYTPDVTENVAIQFTRNFVYENNSIMRIPESFHDPGLFDFSLQIAPRIEAWLGMYIGVKELFDGNPVLNFAIVNKLFYNAPQMSLLDYLLLIVDPKTQSDEVRNARKTQLRSEAMTITKGKRNQLNQYLEGLKMKCTQIWDPRRMRMCERHLTFVKLDDNDAIRTTFEIPTGKGRNAPVARVPINRIYEKNQIAIHYPNLPLVVVKSGANEFSVPMELLEVHEKPQRYKGRIDDLMLLKLIQRATIEPHVYKEKTFDMLNELNFNSEELDFVQKFGLPPNLKMIECPGKVLNEPMLVNKENKRIPMTPVIRGYKEKELNVVPDKELCCALFVIRDIEDLNPCITTEQAHEFYSKLIKGCEFRGMRLGTSEEANSRSILCKTEPDGNKKFAFYPDCPLLAGAANFLNAANHALNMFNSLPDKDKKTLLFIVVANPKLADAYPIVKYHCDTVLGVPSQFVQHHTVLKALDTTSMRIFYQIALKINVKLNGVNQELEWSESGEMTVEEKERRKKMPLKMYVGIDVTHPTTGSGIDFSIAAVVASINAGATRYRDKVVTQQETEVGERPVAHGKEKTDILERKFVELLRIFAENNDNRMPDHIIVYRDGVSDSEMLRVSHDELRSLQMEVACFLKERGAAKDAPHPLYTYIIVQKRHNTRLFLQMPSKPDEKASPEAAKLWDEEYAKSKETGITNPHSGTIVDKVVVVNYKFDFYLASHHGELGTTRPCHYTVMYDNSGLTKDEVYKMTYELSFLYARCRKPISIPAPVMYAHLSCEKAKFKYQAYKSELISEEPANPRASRHVIENYLQPNADYPGMSFA